MDLFRLIDGNEDSDFEYDKVFLRRLPVGLVDQLRYIDDQLRPNKEFNLPLWIRVAIIHFIEDFEGINREFEIEPEDDYEENL